MARTKLTADDRSRLVDSYRQPGVTVSMLAEEFGVSSSTASRILKEDIPTDEYKALVKQKRGGRPSKQKQASQPSLLDAAVVESPPAEDESPVPESSAPEPSQDDDRSASESSSSVERPVLKKRSSKAAEPIADSEDSSEDSPDDFEDSEFDEEAEELGAELFGDDDDAGEDEDEYDSDVDDDDDDDSGSNPWDEQPSQVEVVGPPPAWYSAVQSNPDFTPPAQQDPISIVVLDDEALPHQCFAVVDRFQELTTCLLQEFNHLGDIPNDLAEAKTLPLFDSHRVARRFSDRFRHRGRQKHRVIGFPGYFLFAARDQLHEKGITHLMLDNQVYEL